MTTVGPIIDATWLKKNVPRFVDVPIQKITIADCADVALQQQSVSAKAARTAVDKLKEEYGFGVSTLCMFYNATGTSITSVNNYSWHGHFYAPGAPEGSLGNGQWYAILHVHTSSTAVGTKACLVVDTADAEVMLGFRTPWNSAPNAVWTSVQKIGTWSGSSWEKTIGDNIDNGGKTDTSTRLGITSDMDIGNGTSAYCTAVIKLSA